MANCNKLVGHTWEDPLVYMVSPMASTCDPYATKCTKAEPKILQVKRGQKWRNAPDSARKRRNRVRFGCWREVQRVRTDGETRNPNQNAPDSNATHEKRKPAKPQCFRRFCGRGRRTCLGCRLGRRWSPQATSAPRHAPQAGLRAHLVAKSYRTLTKKSGTAKAIPDFFGRGRRT